jgi:hypothetical protein
LKIPVYFNKKRFKGFIIFICFIFSGANVFSQAETYPVSDSIGIISFQECFRRIEKNNNVRIFYKAEWFENKKIHSSIADLPLLNALSSISRFYNVEYRIIDGNSVVITSKSTGTLIPIDNQPSNVLMVGNQNEFGKSSKAVLRGTISEGATGEPLPGVIIQEEKHKISTLTDAFGHFVLTLPIGENTLKMKYIGYEDNIRKIKLLSDGNADFSLFEKSRQLREVVITDIKTDNNITRSQMGTFHLDNKTIKLMPATLGEMDIIKSMTSLPGVQSPGEFGAGFIVRGGSADQNLMLIEDVPLFNSSHLFGLSTAMNPDGVSSVTLYKAGIPARYGERISSVMSVRLGSDEAGKLKLKGGIGILNSRLSIETPMFKNKAYLLIGGRSSYSNWLLHMVPDLDLKNSTAGFYDLNALFAASISPKDKISVFGYYSSDKFSFNRNTHYQYSNLLSSVRWNHVFNKHLTSALITGMSRYSFSVAEKDTINPQDASSVVFLTSYQTAKWSLSWFPNNQHAIEFGLNGNLYKNSPGKLEPYNDQSAVEPISLGTEKGLELAAYLSDEFTISARLSMEAGLRLVRYTALGAGDVFVFASGVPKSAESITDTLHYGNNKKIFETQGIEPRFSFRYSLGELSSVKIGYNRMDQFINLISNTSVISPTDAWKLSSTNFHPVTCDQYSIGYFRNFRKDAVETSIEVYYKNLQHVIEYKNGARVFMNEHLETDLLDAKAFSYGLELYVKKNTGRVTGWMSYSYSRSLHKTSGYALEDQINGNHYFPSNYDIPHNLTTSMNYQISRRWRFAATFYYNTGRPVTLPELKFQSNGYQLIYYSDRNKYRLPDYHRLDISITLDQNLRLKQKWKGSWTLSVINVYGRKNAYSVYYAQEDPRTWNYSGSYNLYKMYILGIPLPTITYNFSF